MRIIIYVITAVFMTVSACVYTIQEYGDLYLLIGNINGGTVMRIALAFAVICLIVIAVIAITKKEKHRILKTVVCFTASAVMLCCIGISGFFSQTFTYYDFTSPDGEYTVIAGEWMWLNHSGITFYERTNPFFVKRAGGVSLNYGYRPIGKGDYSVQWNENQLKFIVNKGNDYYETTWIYCK